MTSGAPAVQTMSPWEDFLASLLSSSSSVLGGVTVLLLLAFASRRFALREPRKGPPGPRPLPLLGNLLQLDLKRLHLSLCELAEEYGSVFTIYLGGVKIVILAGYKTVKEALVTHADAFGERHIVPIFEELSRGHGIVFANGDSWKELRRFAISTLRDFGMGKRLAEEKIMEVCSHLIPIFEKHKGQPFDTTQPLGNATSNVICSIVFGSQFQYDDAQFTTLVERVKDNILLTGSKQIQLYNNIPWLFSWFRDRQIVLKNFQKNIQDIKDLLAKVKENLNPEDCRGLADCFFMRMQKEDLSDEQNHFSEDNMVQVVLNLFAAGTDTTSTTLRWALLLMLKYPLIQDRVQEELSRVIGSRQVCADDRKNLPYTNAVIHEIQRFSNITTTTIHHRTSQDITFQGHFIEKGTVVLPLLFSVHCDKSEWETPRAFNPSHFLDEEGKFIKRDAFMPFSAGRRACLGEGLARVELFLFFTTLLQRFRFTPPPGMSEDELDLTPVVGFTLSPPHHLLCAVSRC
uniref:cytochrome P450 2K1-like isoform X1 n=1 Tax=Doryrhamphus excisus TaxID=161450 RepID=UPI0025ADA66B|nr:cytochrome P450 2K1-like isoform X1 [Doryrhamphus excisus]XP_057905484.1 cytochrome P450 2K1-like isoform X1 [Doryrhamphus excisus]XP_057905485.1 cytochrome P450 2K1-like isoform X1 [Doryrhamphus excisus]